MLEADLEPIGAADLGWRVACASGELSPGLPAPARLTGCLGGRLGAAGPVASLSGRACTSVRGGGAVLFWAYSPAALERGAERERAAVADLPRGRGDRGIGLAQQIGSQR